MKRLLLILLVALFFCSCSNKSIFDETHTFANNTWMRFEPEKFVLNVDNADDSYDLYVALTVDTSKYRERGLPLILTLESPEQETRTIFGSVILRNEDGSWLGDFNENGKLVCNHKLREYFFFNTPGEYNLEIGQRTSKYEIHGIESLRLNIVKAKLEYPE